MPSKSKAAVQGSVQEVGVFNHKQEIYNQTNVSGVLKVFDKPSALQVPIVTASLKWLRQQ